MYNFILQIAIMLSLGIMVYLIARAVPRVSDEVRAEGGGAITKFGRLFASLRVEKVDVLLNNFLEKLLRKIKLLLMKLDNLTSRYLDKIKKYKFSSNGQKNGEEKPSLFNNNNSNNNGGQ